MATSVKLSSCNWHSLNIGTLACRLTGQRPVCRQHCRDGNQQTKANHTNNANKMTSTVLARNYSNISRNSLCQCSTWVQSVLKPSLVAPDRLPSTSSGKAHTRCITTTSRIPLLSKLLCPTATNSSSLKMPVRCFSSHKQTSAYHAKNKSKISMAFKQKSCRYVFDPVLASHMVDKIWHGQSIADDRLIVDINPGFGYLTQEVLNRGAKNVVAVERKKAFVPGLDKMAEDSDGRLKVFQGNYFNLNQCRGEAPSSKKFHTFEDIFEGLEPLPWISENPKLSANVIGVIPQWQERGQAFSLAACLLKRTKAFHYGRVQHSLVMSERTYKVMVQEPSFNLKNYGNISVMFQLCYNVKLLHAEPITSFKPNSFKQTKPENLFLVQMTPKLDVFDDGLSDEAIYLFVFFLGQMLLRRTALLRDKLEAWVPGHTDIIFDFNFNEKTRTGDLTGRDYLNLFKAIRHLDTFSDFMGMHVCNISPQQVIGFKDYMDQHSSEASEMEEEDFFDSDRRDVAFNY